MMLAHIPTVFLVIVVVSFSLAAAIAAVGYRHKPELMLWAAGMALHGLGYALFSLRGTIPDLISIVAANTAISTMFAVFAQGLHPFLGRRPNLWLIWSPVALTALCFALLIDDMQGRVMAGGLIYGFQGALLVLIMASHRHQVAGRGKYLFIASALLITLLMLVRIVGSLSGQYHVTGIAASDPVQSATYLTSIVCTILIVVGLLLMSAERDEQTVKISETRLRLLFESTSDAVMILEDGNFFDCNPAALKMFGCTSKASFIGKGPAELSPPLQPCGTDSATLARVRMVQAMQTSSNRFEWLHKRMDNDQTFPTEVLLNSMDLHGKHVLQAVVRDITERKQFQQELERQAHLDYLTGLNNRGFFMHQAETELSRVVRYGGALSLLMMDIDFFKQINDTHGHKAGDLVLKQLAEVCRKTLREMDIIGRIGGEEFALLLPETGLAQAAEVAERLRQAMAATKVQIEQGLPIGFTVSIGVAALSEARENLDLLLNLADQALYAAKHNGRNQVRLAGSA